MQTPGTVESVGFREKVEGRESRKGADLTAGIPREALWSTRKTPSARPLCPRLLRGEGQLSARKGMCVHILFEAVTHSRGSLWLLLQLLPLQTALNPKV